jgi:hypothetical protein
MFVPAFSVIPPLIPLTLATELLATNAVVATCVLFVPGLGVGAVTLPLKVAPLADIPAANVFSPVKLLADRPASSTVFPAVSPTNIRLCVMLTANSPAVSPMGAVAPAAMLYLILIFAIVYQYVATDQ